MKEALWALVIDDEPDIRELLSITLDRMGVSVVTAASVQEAQFRLKEQHFDLCLTDMRLPDGSGLELVSLITHDYPRTPVAVITAHGNVDAAVESLKMGAFDFVSKPVDIADLRALVSSALKLDTKSATTAPEPVRELLGESSSMQSVREQITKLARTQAPILITGESGTGKEVAANLIHSCGSRANEPFIAVNCGAIPGELMESEFFGHRKGSFTGAVSDQQGLFKAADGGTLFLDEIAELPLQMQVKLLRVIQEKSVRPVGEAKEVPIDVRLLSATYQSLPALVAAGKFRQDLYYRINVIELRMPSLRERPEDIPTLAQHFLRVIAKDWGMSPIGISPNALDFLQSMSFPGNVRELKNALERAVALCDTNELASDDIAVEDTACQLANTKHAGRGDTPLEDFLADIERDAILKALETSRYNKTQAAKKLGITFRALRYRLKKLDLD